MDQSIRAQLIAGHVARAVEALAGPNGARTVTEARARAVCEQLAQQVATDVASSLLFSLKNGSQVAQELGISRWRVYQLAESRGLGWKIGREIIFRPDEVAAMRERRPGRPRQTTAIDGGS